MKPEIKTRRYVLCPECGVGEFYVEHLFDDNYEDRSVGPWYCKNGDCRMGFSIKVAGEEVELTPTKRYKARGLGLLKFRDLYLVVNQIGNLVGDVHADFFYHSHQCPTSILSTVEEVFDARGNDPHGTMRYVASILDTEETRKRLGAATSLRELFDLFGTDGQPAPTRWPEEDGGMLPFIAEMQREHAKKGDG